MAIWRRGKSDALLYHSDRGSQYSSEQFQRLMADHGVACSISSSDNVWDNAALMRVTGSTSPLLYRTTPASQINPSSSIVLRLQQ
jgi:transposase InsO family protein